MTIFRDSWAKLKDVLFRRHLVEAEAKRGIPLQMRALLKARGWSQDELASRSMLTQGAISRALNPNYGNLTINTIVRIAAGFDVAFVGMFVPFSELLRLKRDDLPRYHAGEIANFEEENARFEKLDGVSATATKTATFSVNVETPPTPQSLPFDEPQCFVPQDRKPRAA